MSNIPAHLVEPPGEIIREELEARGWSQTDLAEAMGRPVAAVNEIINAKRKITTKSAKELGAALGVDAQFWLNLESTYQLAQAGGSASSTAKADLLNYAPIKEMQSRGWLPKLKDVGELTEAVQSFFGVRSLAEQPALAASFRHAADAASMSHVAWCLAALGKAKAQIVQPYRPSKIEELKTTIRILAAHAEGTSKAPRLLADYGIRFVVVKHLRSTKIDGAALWLDDDRRKCPVIVMSLRYGRIDNFWHTLCHEISHIAHRDAFKIDIDIANVRAGEAEDEIEDRANEDAASMLIPQDDLKSFILRKKPYFSSKSIIQFANRIRIHPGVIVGQLQYRKAIKYTHSQSMLTQIRDAVVENSVSDGWIR